MMKWSAYWFMTGMRGRGIGESLVEGEGSKGTFKAHFSALFEVILG